MCTQESSVGKQGVGGKDDVLLALETDDRSSCDDGAGDVADGVILGSVGHNLNIF